MSNTPNQTIFMGTRKFWCGRGRTWGVGVHNSLQRLTHASYLIRNFKVAPYHIAEAISPDTSKGHTSLDISRFKRPKTLLDLLTGLSSAKYVA